MTDVVIIDSGGANLASLGFALQRLGASSTVTSDPAVLRTAARVILPGVGSAGDAMARLQRGGLSETIRSLRQPLLGICLGMQLLYAHSEEADTACLGILPDTVRRIPNHPGLPVPHMGWNQINVQRADPLLAGLDAGEYFYFVHSFAAPVAAQTLASSDYGAALCAVTRRDNFWGVQFHPERSSRAGARVLANFLALH